MTNPIVVDLLQMDIDGAPYWLSPEAKHSHLREQIRNKHRDKYLAKKFGKSTGKVAKRYDENEPRAPQGDPTGGQWVTGGANPSKGGGAGGNAAKAAAPSGISGAPAKAAPAAPVAGTVGATAATPKAGRPAPTEFVSPNTSKLTFAQAENQWFSQAQIDLIHEGEYIDDKLGLQSTNKDAIGAWADGAENSIMFSLPGATWDEARASAAMKGWIANQKAVLVFEPHEDGKELLMSFQANGTPTEIHDRLLELGVKNHTLVPIRGGAVVHVYATDQATHDSVDKAAEAYNTHIEVVHGTGELIGTKLTSGSDSEQRADARKEYEKTIDSLVGKVPGRDIKAIWQDVRNRRLASAAEKELVKADERHRKIEDFKKAKIRASALGDNVDPREQEKFLEEWDSRIKMRPDEFSKQYFGGYDGDLTVMPRGDKWDLSGNIKDGDINIGDIQRKIDWTNKSVYNAYFKLNSSKTGHDMGKRILSSQVDMMRKLGIKKAELSANLDVGGYAWAKYGYVPDQSSWNYIRERARRKLGESSSRSSSSTSTYTPSEWDELTSDQADDIESAWRRDTFDEFLQGEEDNWRENDAPNDAASQVAEEYTDGTDTEWLHDALKEHIDAIKTEDESGDAIQIGGREEDGQPRIPYTVDQLLDAITIEHSGDHQGYGSDAISRGLEIGFDDDKLGEPDNADPKSQLTLPGIEPVAPHEHLTDAMREQLTKVVEEAFTEQAEDVAGRMDAPDYLGDMVREYQDEAWGSMDSAEKYDWAERNNQLPEIEKEKDDDEEPADEPESVADDGEQGLSKIINSSDPKAIWALADHPRGKDILLGSSWHGVLKYDDKQTMDRFQAYVGKQHAQAA